MEAIIKRDLSITQVTVKMNKCIPVQTELGILSGRDCIYLDSAKFSDSQSNFILKGDINGDLCSKEILGEEIPYKVIFEGVLALKMVELDSWDFNSESSFDEILNSSWIKSLGGKVNKSHHHYLFQTYDEVFEVVCLQVNLTIDSKE